MPPPQTYPVNAENSTPGKRLDAWKEIAAYLRRGERTVKRWEVERGLPIHRVPGSGRASVCAYTAELDEWLKSRRAELESEQDAADEAEASAVSAATEVAPGVPAVPAMEPPALPNAPPTLPRAWLLALVAGLLAGVGAGAFYFGAFRNAGVGQAQAPPFLSGKAGANQERAAARIATEAKKARARELCLQGRYEWNQRTPDTLSRALDSFTQAIVQDPGNAEAYVGLADTYNLLEIYSSLPETDAYPRAIAAARKAVELDASLAEAHRALAFAEFYGAWDFVDSEKEFRRAMELNPRDPVTHRWYGNAFAAPGRFSEALEQMDRAQELDPGSHSTLSDKGNLLYESGRREEGIALLEEVERTDPGFYSPHYYMMLISLETHNDRDFLDEGQRAAEIKNDDVLRETIAASRAGYARGGERGLLQGLYAKQQEYYRQGKLHGALLAVTCVLMGKKQEALLLLETAYSRHEMDAVWCVSQPELLTLKNEPRYQALLQKFKFPAIPPSEVPGPSPAHDLPVRASSDPQ